MTTNDPILAALRGEPSPTKITAPKHPTGQLLASYPRMVFDALEASAREHVKHLIVHEGASALDARAATNLDIKRVVTEAVRAGATDLDALDAARVALEKATTQHTSRSATGRPHTVAAAEAAARSWTPRLVRETREEYQR